MPWAEVPGVTQGGRTRTQQGAGAGAGSGAAAGPCGARFVPWRTAAPAGAILGARAASPSCAPQSPLGHGASERGPSGDRAGHSGRDSPGVSDRAGTPSPAPRQPRPRCPRTAVPVPTLRGDQAGRGHGHGHPSAGSAEWSLGSVRDSLSLPRCQGQRREPALPGPATSPGLSRPPRTATAGG